LYLYYRAAHDGIIPIFKIIPQKKIPLPTTRSIFFRGSTCNYIRQ